MGTVPAAIEPTHIHKVASEGFSLQVDAYEIGRPGYPQEGLAYALRELGLDKGLPKQAVDLAAGTGKLTRLLVSVPGLDVVAVEPNEAMIGGFKKVLPEVKILQGAAQQLPFDDSSVDAIFVGQGFHWFAHEAALVEIHRVLRPGGGLALLWNREDDGAPWAAELLQVFEPLSRGIPQYWTGDWVRVWEGDYAKKHFDAPDQDPRSRSRFFRHTTKVTRQQAWERILSRSYVASLAPEKQAEVKAQVNAVLERHGKNFLAPHAGADTSQELAEVPLRLEVFIARKRG
ncbi:hypothetical protein WJX75_007617 [Coccomyxa subellipsoidea]|uniref:Methyltransferase type 11 domain-containing protein n=1 Tax=Coccomyxa subellipsoidea TaxID=248742 RepID=A0ABR2YTZ4_9CHLO